LLIRELLQQACLRLENTGVETPDLDSALLLGHCLDKSRTALYLLAETELSSDNEHLFESLLKRREKREPLAYILGTQEFWSLDFLVNSDVLIPRPETELLLETALGFATKMSQPHGLLVDLCCGSGVIAVVLAKELGRKVLAIDLSMEAIVVARENARRHGVLHLVSFLQSDLLSGLIAEPCVSLLVSNPPYVSREDMAQGLQIEVQHYEPHLALDGGEKGLEIIQRIREELPPRLMTGAHLLIEIGSGQGHDLLSLFGKENSSKTEFTDLWVKNDYADHERIFHAKLDL